MTEDFIAEHARKAPGKRAEELEGDVEPADQARIARRPRGLRVTTH